MCARSVVTSASSVACASLRYCTTRASAASRCSGSFLSIVAIRWCSPGVHAGKPRGTVVDVPPSKRMEVAVEGRTLSLSNLDKVFYPETGFTKGQVIEYYARIAPVLLPHLRDRPLTLKRYPDGVEGLFFYEKNCPQHRPPWVRTAEIRGTEKVVTYCMVQDLPTLVWCANLASLELHPSLSRARNKAHPTTAVFDLDPGEPAAIPECAQ